MTAAPPPRDSVLEGLGYAFRVLGKPGFLWAPVLLYLILMIPLIPLYSLALDTTPTVAATREEMDAFVRGFIPTLIAALVLILVISPIASAVMFKLAQQYVDGEAPRPFAPGIASLALRYFLTMLVIAALAVVALLVGAIVFGLVQAVAGAGLAFLIAFVGEFVAYLYLFLRLSLVFVLLLSGYGPVETFKRSWELTRGHMGRVFRWLFVSGLVVGIAAGLIGAIVGALFIGFDQPVLGQVLGTVLAAPFGIVSSIVLVLLVRLLTSPVPSAPPPSPALPEWMNADVPTAEPPAAPST